MLIIIGIIIFLLFLSFIIDQLHLRQISLIINIIIAIVVFSGILFLYF